MKEYKVQWSPARDPITHTIEAENEQEAFNIVVEKYRYPTTKHIWVSWDSGFNDKRFNNPHFDPNQVEPEKDDGLKRKESKMEESQPRNKPHHYREVPQSTGWARLYFTGGTITFVGGSIITLGAAANGVKGIGSMALMTVFLSLNCYFFSFLIDVLTDMRHYLKRIAEKE